jgi:hypothetical protein
LSRCFFSNHGYSSNQKLADCDLLIWAGGAFANDRVVDPGAGAYVRPRRSGPHGDASSKGEPICVAWFWQLGFVVEVGAATDILELA